LVAFHNHLKKVFLHLASDIHVLRNIIGLSWEDTFSIAEELFYLCLEETYL